MFWISRLEDKVQLTEHLTLLFPEPPSLAVPSPATVGALTVMRLFISGSVLATQGPSEKHGLRKAAERKPANQQENKQPTFNKNRERLTHRGKHRGRHPLTASLSCFQTWRAGSSAASDGGLGRWTWGLFLKLAQVVCKLNSMCRPPAHPNVCLL